MQQGVRPGKHPEELAADGAGVAQAADGASCRTSAGTGLEFGEGCRGKVSHGLIGSGGQAAEGPEPVVARIEPAVQAGSLATGSSSKFWPCGHMISHSFWFGEPLEALEAL